MGFGQPQPSQGASEVRHRPILSFQDMITKSIASWPQQASKPPDKLLSGRGSLSGEGQLKVMDDPVHHSRIRNKSDDLHLSSALITNQRIYLEDLADHFCPATARESRALLLDDDEGRIRLAPAPSRWERWI